MGIRYYAYPVAAELVERARADPELFLSDDPLLDAWGSADRRPPMLYLDKCWSYLQQLTWPNRMESPRVCYRLFEGDVHYCDPSRGCWRPWIRLLDPGEVAAVARDLVLLDADDVATMIAGWAYRRPEDHAYVTEYLHHAQQFVTDLARSGDGLVYTIR